jgi:hypothetical protein
MDGPLDPIDHHPQAATCPNRYRVGPVYRIAVVISGGMCAGLAIAILAALALHRIEYAQVLAASVPPSSGDALGFLACGLALIGIGYWFPVIASLFGMVTLSFALTIAAERLFGSSPKVGHLISSNLGTADWQWVGPNTLAVLLLAGTALLLRRTHRWPEYRLGAVGVLGSVVFGIGTAACAGYMVGAPTYSWHAHAPMSFLSAICSAVSGLGIVMSAYRYGELDESGVPRWLPLAICVGALAIDCSTAIAFICGDGRAWHRTALIGLLPMITVSSVLVVVAARSTKLSWLAERRIV